LSADEIAELRKTVDIQSHTVLHPILPRCESDRAHREIAESRRDLEANFGVSVYALAYPNGDYTDREIELARAAGYECALSMDFGFNSAATPMFRLKRICINDDAGINELALKASGVWGWMQRWVRALSPRWTSPDRVAAPAYGVGTNG
jgi:peptidoglycan/xylan/chitin deacetylase (PgdA/CDA1 family)